MTPEAEQLLQRVILGEVEESDPRVGDLRAVDADFAAQLAEILAVQDTLSRVGAKERSVLGEAGEEDGGALSDRAEAQLRAGLRGAGVDPQSTARSKTVETSDPGGGRPLPRPLPRLVLAGALAAGLLAVLAIALQRDDGSGLEPGKRLGGTIERVAPVGGAGFAHFEWKAALPEHGWFVVRVYDASGAELARSPELEAPRWEPAAEGWPEFVVWDVRAFDAGGNRVARSERFEARR